MSSVKRLLRALPVLAGLAASSNATADNRLGATPETAAPRAVAAQVALGEISPTTTHANASFATAGAGLRNRLLTSIVVPGDPAEAPRAAYLYWAVITNGAVPAEALMPKIARRSSPTVRATALAAVQVGTGPSPCWGGTGITVYRANVPLSVARGGGVYEVSFPSGASGTPNNRNPWDGSDFPMLEGASLILIYNGDNTVAIYDVGLAGQTIAGDILSYTLRLPQIYTAYLRYDNIGADGQIGFGREPTTNTSMEDTFIDTTKIAGPGSVYNDSLWNGGVSGPIPQLWDDTAINLTNVVPPGAATLSFSHSAVADCVTPVANVIAVR